MDIQKDILSTLVYFDIFNYPLRKREIFLFLSTCCDYHSFDTILDDMVYSSVIFKLGEFYSLQNNYNLSHRRKQGNKRAKNLLVTAEKAAAFLAKFPFVRGVGVSGSLSKEFADENSDIDFFIITKSNRMWIARTIMHFFKKLTFLINRQHYFCMNYYVDEVMLEIKEKNVYTATEVVTLLPYKGYDAFNKFYAANGWTKNFLPNNHLRIDSAEEMVSPFLKKAIEAILDNRVGDLVDILLMKITSKRWLIKTKNEKLNSRGLVMSMDASRHFSKPDPTFFQEELMQLYNSKCYEILAKCENAASAHLSKT